MPPDEKKPELSGSSPPRAPLSDFEVAIALHKIKWELAAINQKLEKAEQNDERFKQMETHFNAVKWFARIAVVAALGSLFAVVAARMSSRLEAPPPPPPLQGR